MRKLLIGLLTVGSFSAFAGDFSLKVVHCKGPVVDNCKEVTNKSLGKKVANKLAEARIDLSNGETIEVTLDEGCRTIIDACQEDSYKESVKATVKDKDGTVLRTESVEKFAPLFGSSKSLLAELIEKL